MGQLVIYCGYDFMPGPDGAAQKKESARTPTATWKDEVVSVYCSVNIVSRREAPFVLDRPRDLEG